MKAQVLGQGTLCIASRCQPPGGPAPLYGPFAPSGFQLEASPTPLVASRCPSWALGTVGRRGTHFVGIYGKNTMRQAFRAKRFALAYAPPLGYSVQRAEGKRQAPRRPAGAPSGRGRTWSSDQQGGHPVDRMTKFAYSFFVYKSIKLFIEYNIFKKSKIHQYVFYSSKLGYSDRYF